jgi:hydrogenase maturation protease
VADGAEELLRPQARRILVVGMGNPILTDDAVGIRLATEFARRLTSRRVEAPGLALSGPTPPHVDVIDECSCGGLSLLDLVVGYDRLILLDAIKTREGIPGAWYELTAGDLRETLHMRNVHDVNLATALTLGRRLGLHVPSDAEIHIFAVEVDDVGSFGESMTPALEEAFLELVEEIFPRVLVLLAAA